MRASVRVLATPELAVGFALAGLPVEEVDSIEEGMDRLSGLLNREGVGVILVEQTFLDAIPEAVRGRLRGRPVPIVVPFPRPVWAGPPAAPEEYIVDVLRRAIGYRVKLR